MESVTLAPGTLVAGRYRIVRELGRGAMGAVYAVEHVESGVHHALKVLLDAPERAARFRREARASARIASEHVVKVSEADTAPELGGAPFLVMELLDGEDVERRLLRAGSLRPQETLEILVQVARGLDDAHAAGVIHRDLKPENVFLHRRADGSTIVKVVDFGISKVVRLESDVGLATMTDTSELVGTPLYMAPEQIHASEDLVVPATDVWAVGLMTLRMLTGHVYWTGETVHEIFVQIMADRRTAPSERWSGLGEAFDGWFLRSVAPRACDRFSSVGQQVSELARVLDGLDDVVVAAVPPAPRRAPAFTPSPSSPPPSRPRHSLTPLDVSVSQAARERIARGGRYALVTLALVAFVGVGITLLALTRTQSAREVSRAVLDDARTIGAPLPTASDAAAPLPAPSR